MKTRIPEIRTWIMAIRTCIPSIRTCISPLRIRIPPIRTCIPKIVTRIPAVRTCHPSIRTCIPSTKTYIPSTRIRVPSIRTCVSSIWTRQETPPQPFHGLVCGHASPRQGKAKKGINVFDIWSTCISLMKVLCPIFESTPMARSLQFLSSNSSDSLLSMPSEVHVTGSLFRG